MVPGSSTSSWLEPGLHYSLVASTNLADMDFAIQPFVNFVRTRTGSELSAVAFDLGLASSTCSRHLAGVYMANSSLFKTALSSLS